MNKLGGEPRAAGYGYEFVESGDLPCGLGTFGFIGNRQMRENALDAHQPCGFKFKGARHQRGPVLKGGAVTPKPRVYFQMYTSTLLGAIGGFCYCF